MFLFSQSEHCRRLHYLNFPPFEFTKSVVKNKNGGMHQKWLLTLSAHVPTLSNDIIRVILRTSLKHPVGRHGIFTFLSIFVIFFNDLPQIK